MIPTIVVGGVLALVVALIVGKLVRDRKRGGSCGCGCEGCPSSGICHPSGPSGSTSQGEAAPP